MESLPSHPERGYAAACWWKIRQGPHGPTDSPNDNAPGKGTSAHECDASGISGGIDLLATRSGI